jgi:hypothetical protein
LFVQKKKEKERNDTISGHYRTKTIRDSKRSQLFRERKSKRRKLGYYNIEEQGAGKKF